MLQEAMNDNTYGYSFRVFASVGQYEEAYRSDNSNDFYKLINVILADNANDVTELKNGYKMQSRGMTLSYLVPLKDHDNDIESKELQEDEHGNIVEVVTSTETGNNDYLAGLREFFMDFFAKPALMFNDLTKEYVMWVFQNPVEQSRDVLAGVGFAITYSQSAVLYCVEHGLNERQINYFLDGDLIPFDQMTQYRNPTINGYVSKDADGKVNSTELQFQKTWSFIFPSFWDLMGTRIVEYLNGVDKPNTAHILKTTISQGYDILGKPDIKKTYWDLVLFGQTSIQAEATKNASFSLALVNAPEDFSILNFPSGFVLYDVTAYNATLAHATANDGIYGYSVSEKSFFDFGANADLTNTTYLVTTKAITALASFKIKEY